MLRWRWRRRKESIEHRWCTGICRSLLLTTHQYCNVIVPSSALPTHNWISLSTLNRLPRRTKLSWLYGNESHFHFHGPILHWTQYLVEFSVLRFHFRQPISFGESSTTTECGATETAILTEEGVGKPPGNTESKRLQHCKHDMYTLLLEETNWSLFGSIVLKCSPPFMLQHNNASNNKENHFLCR